MPLLENIRFYSKKIILGMYESNLKVGSSNLSKLEDDQDSLKKLGKL